jgi:hypothetical protein
MYLLKGFLDFFLIVVIYRCIWSMNYLCAVHITLYYWRKERNKEKKNIKFIIIITRTQRNIIASNWGKNERLLTNWNKKLTVIWKLQIELFLNCFFSVYTQNELAVFICLKKCLSLFSLVQKEKGIWFNKSKVQPITIQRSFK